LNTERETKEQKMKNEKNVFLIIVLLALIIPVSSNANYLIEIYKKGEILLEEDPSFGKDVDWEELFYDISKEMVIGPDGSIYVTNARQHKVYHFSKDGQFLKEFGQKGQGPLDFYHPNDPTILDNRYLVVKDYTLNRKITLVDLEHIDRRHVKVIKTEKEPWVCIALKNNKIAYIDRKHESISKWEKKRTFRVIIKDAVTGNEAVAVSYEFAYKCRSNSVRTLINMLVNYFPEVCIDRTKEGYLLVGYSERADVEIFSLEGKRIRSFHLAYRPIKVTNTLRDEIMDKLTNSLQGTTRAAKKIAEDFRNAMKGATLIGNHLPYYNNIMVDSAGNILIFPNTNCLKDCEIQFQVYSPKGKYICSTRIKTGIFDYKLNRFLKQLLFTENGIYGLFQLKGTEDISLRLVRVKLGTK
jgi:hypothetical protein